MKNDKITANNFVIVRLAIIIGVLVFFTNHILKYMLLSSKYYQIIYIVLPMLPIIIDVFTFKNNKENNFKKLIKKKIIQYWLCSIIIGVFFVILHIKDTKIIMSRFQTILIEAILLTILLTFREIKLYKIAKIDMPKSAILLIIVYICVFQIPAYILSLSYTLDYKLFDIIFSLSMIISYAPAILNIEFWLTTQNGKLL